MKKIVQMIIISCLIGLFSAAFCSLFLNQLNVVTLTRENNLFLIWGLGLFGFLLGIVMRKMPQSINFSLSTIVQKIDDPNCSFSSWTLIFIFFTALATHLLGGSSGREGVGVIIGVALAMILYRSNIKIDLDRKFLIYLGISSGFSAIFSTPFAGMIFCFEIFKFKEKNNFSLLFCVVLTSLLAYGFTRLMIEHYEYPLVKVFLDIKIVYYLIIAIISAVIGSYLYSYMSEIYFLVMRKIFKKLEWRLLVGGLFISLIVYFSNAYDYVGIGTKMIEESFISSMSVYDFLMKCLLTVMTVSIGFKGGEVTPLFFMGATLSNSIASFFGLTNFALSSSLGMIALFSTLTRTPLASSVMACELFGWRLGVISLIVCFTAQKIVRLKSIYQN